MKKRWIAALTAAGVLGAGLLAVRGAAPAGEAEPEAAGKYVLGEYGGKVAVFCPKLGELPRRITAIEVGTLPALDRERLQSGIPVDDRTTLTMLLEDLGC